MKRKTLTRRLDLKTVSDDGDFAGYGSVFGIQDSYGDIVARGAFAKSIADKGPGGIKLLWQHRIEDPIGIYTRIEEDERGLYVEGRLLIDDDPLAKRAHAHLKAGSLDGLSIGYVPVRWEWGEGGDIRTLKEIDLWEVSLVTFPALDVARVGAVKTIRQFEAFLRDEGGFAHAEARRIAEHGFKAFARSRDEMTASDSAAAALARLRDIITS